MYGLGTPCSRSRQVVVVQRPVVLPPPPLTFDRPAVKARPVSACSSGTQTEPQDPDQRLSMAQTEYVNGNYECAMQLARAEIRTSPARAYRIIGAAGCYTRDLAAANQAYRHLAADGRQYLTYVCGRQGIRGQGNQFVAE